MSIAGQLSNYDLFKASQERDFWANANFVVRAWRLRVQYAIMLVCSVLFARLLYGDQPDSDVLYNAVLYASASIAAIHAAMVVYFEALAYGFRKEDRLEADKQAAGARKELEREHDALRITRLTDESTYGAFALKKYICFVHPNSVAEKGIKWFMPDGTTKQVVLSETVKKALTSKLLLVDLKNLTPQQKDALDRYLDKCDIIEDHITSEVSDPVKAKAHAKIDELAAAADVELRMIKDTAQTLADMRLQMRINDL